MSTGFDAIVLGTSSRATVGGLTLAERGRRVAIAAGAKRVWMLDVARPDPAAIHAWAADAPTSQLLAIDVTESVIHTPLLQTALGPGSAMVVDPDGQFGGVVLAEVEHRDELIAAVNSTLGLAELADRWRAAGARVTPYGDLARTFARTSSERGTALYFLFGLIRKVQDSWMVRNINRKIAYPFTRLLLPLRFISPNMLSVCVFLIGAIGCYILTEPTYEAAVTGAGLLLFAGYLDACDGEIARIRLETSKLGAWLDTMADEATTVLTVICFGIHVYQSYEYPWLAWLVVIGGILATVGVLQIYYYLLTSGDSGNSQDYPTSSPILAFLRYLIRREVINLGTFFLCLLGLIEVLYALLFIGAVVSSSVLTVQTVQRLRSRRTASPAPSPSS